MVTDAYGIAGSDLGIGADVLIEAALSPRFAAASGAYYDNDNRRFASPHPDAGNADIVSAVMQAVETALTKF